MGGSSAGSSDMPPSWHARLRGVVAKARPGRKFGGGNSLLEEFCASFVGADDEVTPPEAGPR
jgi:hypothetical protein